MQKHMHRFICSHMNGVIKRAVNESTDLTRPSLHESTPWCTGFSLMHLVLGAGWESWAEFLGQFNPTLIGFCSS